MKYNYDKKLLKQFGVGPFLGQVKLREKMIAEAPDTPPVSIYNANILAILRHGEDAVLNSLGCYSQKELEEIILLSEFHLQKVAMGKAKQMSDLDGKFHKILYEF